MDHHGQAVPSGMSGKSDHFRNVGKHTLGARAENNASQIAFRDAVDFVERRLTMLGFHEPKRGRDVKIRPRSGHRQQIIQLADIFDAPLRLVIERRQNDATWSRRGANSKRSSDPYRKIAAFRNLYKVELVIAEPYMFMDVDHRHARSSLLPPLCLYQLDSALRADTGTTSRGIFLCGRDDLTVRIVVAPLI
jgi:hypothetical protein